MILTRCYFKITSDIFHFFVNVRKSKIKKLLKNYIYTGKRKLNNLINFNKFLIKIYILL